MPRYVRPWGSDQLVAVGSDDAARAALAESLSDALRARCLGVDELAAAGRCWFDETHRVAVVNPRWDGFLVASYLAPCDIEQLRIVCDESLASSVTAHLLNSNMRRGQVRPIDLELHPGTLPRRGVTGGITAYDGLTKLDGTPLRLTLFPSRAVTCSVAGNIEGPLPAERLDRVVARIRAGWYPAAKLSAQIDRAASTTGGRRRAVGSDPWWSLPEDDI